MRPLFEIKSLSKRELKLDYVKFGLKLGCKTIWALIKPMFKCLIKLPAKHLEVCQ